ncbi:DUF4062 domain-containing protein [Hymenobacter coccineus]|uniref:DUF4062 domain-containing protein n=1 Tax=Hymenobacter coccineus TaxID=1908235 RepID=A0A1G1TMM8_9BACT|nr:DUF4062 domain-containing protein [Hymenobacter coccineus]OGX92123.1 hypothetical protein BEN49_03575 [Hymenobacter coccineus]
MLTKEASYQGCVVAHHIIQLMAKKYQVFISSTFDDLKEHRDAVVKAVLQLGHLPVGMEMFNAGDQTQWETIKSYIDSSDYYLVILAHRYGSKDPASGLSYTEKEYDYAGEQGVPRLGFVIRKEAAWPAHLVETKAKRKLDAFKKKVSSNRVINFWETPKELAFEVFASLGNEIAINPRVGWVRATEAASPQVAEELARLSKENKKLIEQLHSLRVTENLEALENKLREINYELKIGASSKTYQLYEILMAVLKPDKNRGIEIVREITTHDIEMFRAATSELEMLDLIFYEKEGNHNEMKMTQKAKRIYVKNNYSL